MISAKLLRSLTDNTQNREITQSQEENPIVCTFHPHKSKDAARDSRLSQSKQILRCR